MYSEERSGNILGLLIKIVIIVIFAILVIWLISKVVNKSNNNAFEKNMIIMKNASIEYFKKDNLPEKEGDSKKVTLDDLIKMKYITSFDKKCDRQKSYSKATMIDDYYALRVELLCGNNKKFIYTSIDKDGNCLGDNCDDNKIDNNNQNENNENNNDGRNDNVEEYDENQVIDTENDSSAKNDNDNNGSNDNGSGKNNDSNQGKTLYYEHVRVNKVYSDWQYSRISGDNVETKQEIVTMNNYCPLITSDYYVVVYYPRNVGMGTVYRNVIRLDNVSSSASDVKLKKVELFNNNSSYYSNYISNSSKTTVIVGNDAYGVVSSAYMLEMASLKSSNVTIKKSFLSPGNYGVGVELWIVVNNVSNVYAYNNMYFVPVHFTAEYVDKLSCVRDTASNSSKYSGYIVDSSSNQTVTLYRSYTYQKNENDKKWSTSKTLDGYTLTGRTEYR